MKLSTLISALLILVSIGTLGINLAWATVRIRDDPGGRIDKYLERFTKLRDSHEQIIVDGTCNSACTLLLGTIPSSRICVTKRASLGFHAAWVFDDDGNPVQSPSWTRVLWRNYPPTIRDWITRNGGLTRRMIFLRGDELNAMYPRQFETVLRDKCRKQEQRFKATLIAGFKKVGSSGPSTLLLVNELLTALREQSMVNYTDMLRKPGGLVNRLIGA